MKKPILAHEEVTRSSHQSPRSRANLFLFFAFLFSFAPPVVAIVPPLLYFCTAQSDSSVEIRWRNNEGGVVGYIVARKSGADSAFQVVKTTSSVTSVTYLDIGLLPSYTYWYAVRAFTNADTSAFSNWMSATTLPSTPVSRPIRLSISLDPLTNKLKLAFNDSSNYEQGFRIFRATETTGFEKAGEIISHIPKSMGALAWTDTALNMAPNMLYYYRVKSFSSADSTLSNTDTFFTLNVSELQQSARVRELRNLKRLSSFPIRLKGWAMLHGDTIYITENGMPESTATVIDVSTPAQVRSVSVKNIGSPVRSYDAGYGKLGYCYFTIENRLLYFNKDEGKLYHSRMDNMKMALTDSINLRDWTPAFSPQMSLFGDSILLLFDYWKTIYRARLTTSSILPAVRLELPGMFSPFREDQSYILRFPLPYRGARIGTYFLLVEPYYGYVGILKLSSGSDKEWYWWRSEKSLLDQVYPIASGQQQIGSSFVRDSIYLNDSKRLGLWRYAFVDGHKRRLFLVRDTLLSIYSYELDSLGIKDDERRIAFHPKQVISKSGSHIRIRYTTGEMTLVMISDLLGRVTWRSRVPGRTGGVSGRVPLAPGVSIVKVVTDAGKGYQSLCVSE